MLSFMSYGWLTVIAFLDSSEDKTTHSLVGCPDTYRFVPYCRTDLGTTANLVARPPHPVLTVIVIYSLDSWQGTLHHACSLHSIATTRLCPQMRLAEKELIATSRDLALVSYRFCAHEAIHAQTAAEREERSLASITRGVVH